MPVQKRRRGLLRRGLFGNSKAAATAGTERVGRTTPVKRRKLLAEIEALRERTWRDKSIKTGSPEWDAVVAQCAEMRKRLKGKGK